MGQIYESGIQARGLYINLYELLAYSCRHGIDCYTKREFIKVRERSRRLRGKNGSVNKGRGERKKMKQKRIVIEIDAE